MEIFQVFLIAFFSIFFFMLCCGCFAFVKEQERRRRTSYESAQSILSLYRRRPRTRSRRECTTNSRTIINSPSRVYQTTLPLNQSSEIYPPIFFITSDRFNDDPLDSYRKYSNELPTYDQVFGKKGPEKPK
jgi:hypothetical protein